MSRNAKAIQSKSRSHQVDQITPDRFTVTSGASGNSYTVTIVPTGARCTCDWAKYRKQGQPCGCSHVVSVMNYLAQQDGRTVSAWASQEQATRQHRPVTDIGDGLILTSRLS